MFPCIYALFSRQNSRLGIQWLSHHGNYLAFYFILIRLSLLLSLFMKSTIVAVSKGDNLMYPLHYSSLFRGPMQSISVLPIYILVSGWQLPISLWVTHNKSYLSAVYTQTSKDLTNAEMCKNKIRYQTIQDEAISNSSISMMHNSQNSSLICLCSLIKKKTISVKIYFEVIN